MTDDTKRHPHPDNDTIEIDELEKTPSQGGSSGGDLQREVGALDEEKTATGADPMLTSVHKGLKPSGGDAPNLPNRQQTGEQKDKAEPKRTG